ncbi:conserved leucine-rich repeat protein [Purpureocillium lavendulum]|uniref:Conserved leucine-rich repeat protein n=1 Tax=Purpureocillium lavendulum TaxID=1247861 RepID=A0AB34FM47_9HYPO|nr:conserved leucine-rich repeat protein [Purpureocillium lavendulum]
MSTRKSSAALREQIAKAKAAKRAAVRRTSGTREHPTGDNGQSFSRNEDFAVDHHDPFNLRKGEYPGAKVLKQRVAAARTTGRLNVAALGLKEIPSEVLHMYDLESIGAQDGSWAESVDLTRLVAADNLLEALDDAIFPDTSLDAFQDDDDGRGNIFGGLETLDLHGNILTGVPLGFRRLTQLSSLNLSSNHLDNSCLDIISQMTSLRDLKIAKNRLTGPLDAAIANLELLEMLDLHGNSLSALPPNLENMARLRILNLNENHLESVPFDALAKLPLTELTVKKNRLSGTLIQLGVEVLPYLQSLDASSNQLTQLISPGSKLSLPAVHAVSLAMNRLQALPDMSSWINLLTLAVEENNISAIPDSFTGLEKLRHADFASNDIRVVPPEISRMGALAALRLTGNPLRDRKLISASIDVLKETLAVRLEPPPPYQETRDQATITGLMEQLSGLDTKAMTTASLSAGLEAIDDESRSDVDDQFATPPTSAPHSPDRSRSQTMSSDKSASLESSAQTWAVKPGGVLDRSRMESSTLDSTMCAAVAAQHQVRQVQLHHNLFTCIPVSLSALGITLSSLSLTHNQLAGDAFLTARLELPALREMNLASNHITSLRPLNQYLEAPVLEKIDVSMNRIKELPEDLKQAFPRLSVLLVANNQLTDLGAETIRGLRIVDASNNDIAHLNPRIGLLGGNQGLQRLEVTGNRFKVPRWNILERGTEATLQWLRGRVPAEDMAAWKEENGDDSNVD